MAAKGPTHIAGLDLRDELVVELGRNRAGARRRHQSANVVADGAGIVQNAALGILRRHLPLVGEAVHSSRCWTNALRSRVPENSCV